MEPENQQQQDDLERAQAHLQASLITPIDQHPLPPMSPAISNPHFPISELTTLMGLLQAQSQRIDQMAKLMGEQFGRVESVLEQMTRTMQLAQLMIAEQDRQQVTLVDLMERQEIATAALVRVNANLSEIVAALLGPQQQKS